MMQIDLVDMIERDNRGLGGDWERAYELAEALQEAARALTLHGRQDAWLVHQTEVLQSYLGRALRPKKTQDE